MKLTILNNAMALLLPLLAAAALFFAGSANALCCRVPGQPCANYAVASCFPYATCATCPNAPMDSVTKAGSLEELFKIEVAEQALKKRKANVLLEAKSEHTDDFEERNFEDGLEARDAKDTGDTEGAAVSKREHAKKDFPEEGQVEVIDA